MKGGRGRRVLRVEGGGIGVEGLKVEGQGGVV